MLESDGYDLVMVDIIDLIKVLNFLIWFTFQQVYNEHIDNKGHQFGLSFFLNMRQYIVNIEENVFWLFYL